MNFDYSTLAIDSPELLVRTALSLPDSKLFPDELRASLLFDLSGIQDSFRFRALYRARVLAKSLIDERGEMRKAILQQLLTTLEQEGHLFTPSGTSDGALTSHLLHILPRLQDGEFLKLLNKFHLPLAHGMAEELIRETLDIEGPVTLSHVRQAVLSACLTPLRQNVGSCFASAPAILIQAETPERLLEDLFQLLLTGKLKRTFGGTEYALPLSPSTGMGDLKKNLLHYPHAALCPGLIAALGPDTARLIAEQGKKTLSSEELIRAHFLAEGGLKEEDLLEERKLEQMALRSGSSPGKLDLIRSFREKERKARSRFKRTCDNALLRAWEFTLASFSEVKMEFSRWNLFTSLGFSPEENGGIGQVIHQRIDEKIQEINQKLERSQREYENAFDQAKTAEVLLRNASSETEARRLQAEYQAKAYHMRSSLEARDELYSHGSHFATLFSFLLKQYDTLFPRYFQEAYDAEMQDVQLVSYEDSPAGFRLLYKHGRQDPSLWSWIYDKESYIAWLISFFKATEMEVGASCDWEGGQEEISKITSEIIAHLETPLFLDSALARMAKAHVKGAKPWAYTSGGTMTTLLKTYCHREGEFSQEERWVESPSDLLIYLLDTLKNAPPLATSPFIEDRDRRMLMASPTHAFLLIPGEESFTQGWQKETFTYTWVRDEIFLPSQKFYAEMRLTPPQQTLLLETFSERFPLPKRPSGSHSMTVKEWRNHLLVSAPHLADAIDGFLYEALPLVPGGEWKACVCRLLSDRMEEGIEEVLRRLPDVPAPYLTASGVRDAAKACFLLAQGKRALDFDLHQFIAKHARFIGLAAPSPVLFADTNWSEAYFGCVVNPGTGQFELWRLDRTLTKGSPMTSWKPFVTGIDRRPWTVYTRPKEYGT